jgi:hypothetical protein
MLRHQADMHRLSLAAPSSTSIGIRETKSVTVGEAFYSSPHSSLLTPIAARRP